MTPAPFADPLTQRLAEFIREIGLRLEPAELGDDTVQPGVAVRDGALLVDAARLRHPGDLLHEAGHLAVCDPSLRSTPAPVGDDPGEEMGAIAWSYAAALHLGIDPALVFHRDGYRGGGDAILAGFARGGMIGQPMLEWFGLTLSDKAAAERSMPPFPHMLRWLR